jgi:putative phage-type endonuclease
VIPTQNTPFWLEWRRSKIGASDAPIIMQISPWTTPLQLWEQKLGLVEQKAMNFAMKRGHDLEDQARREFEKMTGLIVFPEVVQHPKIDYMVASFDGIDLFGKNIVEIKCPGKKDYQCALDGKIPEKYYPQLQHQIEVSGLEKSYYFSFNGLEGKVLEIYRDDKYIEELLRKESEFWDCVQNFREPRI